MATEVTAPCRGLYRRTRGNEWTYWLLNHEVGTYRGAAAICGTTHKTVKRIVDRHEAGGAAPQRAPRSHNYDDVRETVAKQVDRTHEAPLPTSRTGLAGREQSSRARRAVTPTIASVLGRSRSPVKRCSLSNPNTGPRHGLPEFRVDRCLY